MKTIILLISLVLQVEGSEIKAHRAKPAADDLKVENIDAFAFAGGGFRALVYEWSVFHTLAKAQKKSLQEMLGKKSVGSNSGGSWFMNRLLYDPNVIASFKTEVTIKDNVEKMINTTLENLYSRRNLTVSQDHIPAKLLCKPGEFVSKFPMLEYYIKGACEKETRSVILSYLQTENGWMEFTKDMHKNFNVETELKNIRWTTIAALNLEFQYEYRKLTNCHEVSVHSMLRSNNDAYHKFPGFPVLSSFEKENDEMKIHVTIPKIEEHDNSLRLERVETHQVFKPFYEKNTSHSVMNITALEILARIEESITDPKLHSGPSGNFLGVVASSHFFGFLTNAVGHVLYKTLAVANKLYKTVWTTRAFKDKSHEVPIGLADGGAHENTGIVAAVKNLQHHGNNTGRIFAIVPKQLRTGIKGEKLRGLKVESQYDELKNLFETTEKNSGVKPYPKIFKGSFDDYKVESISSEKIDAFVIKVQTINNEDYGIKAGSTYKLIYISPLCRSEKVQKRGGNNNGDIALLPSMGTALAYAECADIIARDMRELLQQECIKHLDKATRQTNEESTENIIEKQENIEDSVQDNNLDKSSAAIYSCISWLFVLSYILLN